ncbi:MAG TPA: thioredoxin-like domain-containing protein, partial [Leptospiraceae bacterium]|nr:thioredoxin-like domain-containing protein [Leptospiraceae bacterium]
MRFRFFFQIFLFFSPVLITLSCRDRDRIVELEKERENEIGYMEFPAGLDWINADKPVKMKDLKGRISILYFWTYSCTKCSDIPEELTEFSEKWKDVVTVIGIHSGKFPNEKDSANVRTAVRREGIGFPVVNDPNLVLWRAYGLNSWPAFILIGADGKLIGRNTGRNFREQFDSIFEDIVRESEKKGELKRNAVSLPVSASAKTEPALLFPSSLHLAKDHKTLYISDTNHHRVIIFDLEKNEIQSVIGTGRRGNRNGKFSEAEFSHPSGLVLKDDMLYIADRKNRSIRRADLKKKEVS